MYIQIGLAGQCGKLEFGGTAVQWPFIQQKTPEAVDRTASGAFHRKER